MCEFLDRNNNPSCSVGTRISWNLDEACHPRAGRPYTSDLFPDVVFGLRITIRENFFTEPDFISEMPSLTEPSASPLVNEGRFLSFLYLICERKAGSGESLKAQNHLALPTVKALDVLKGVNLDYLLIVGLVTVGSKWEVWIGEFGEQPTRHGQVINLFPTYT